MKPLLLLAVFAFLLPGLLPAQTFVWPGDANNNGIVSHVDVLYIGLGYSFNGPIRQGASLNWGPQQAASLWSQSFSGGVNYVHADCDGNGLINEQDILAIDTNYRNLVTPNGGTDSTTIGTNSSPSLEVKFSTDTLPVSGQTVVQTSLNLGDSANVVDSLYGIAFSLTYDPTIVDSISIDLDGGWIARNGGDSLILTRAYVDNSTGRIDAVISRTDQQNATGAGLIGSINIVMDDNIRIAADYTLGLQLTSVFALTRAESEVLLQMKSDSLTVVTPLTSAESDLVPPLRIYPNPAHDQVVIETNQLLVAPLRLYDASGKLISSIAPQASYRHQLALGHLPAGMYFLEYQGADARFRKKLLLAPR